MKKLLHFAKEDTYFGINVHRYGVKVSDLEKLPFFDLFTEYHDDSMFLTPPADSFGHPADFYSDSLPVVNL